MENAGLIKYQDFPVGCVFSSRELKFKVAFQMSNDGEIGALCEKGGGGGGNHTTMPTQDRSFLLLLLLFFSNQNKAQSLFWAP